MAMTNPIPITVKGKVYWLKWCKLVAKKEEENKTQNK